MTLKINGATGGSVSLDAPDNTSPAGTDVTLTLPTSAGSSGQVLVTDGTGTLSWGAGSQWTTSGSNIYYTTGSVGIGTSSPSYALDVKSGTGQFAFSNTGSNPRLGFLANNVAENAEIHSYALKFYTGGSAAFDGTERVRITSGGALLHGDTANSLTVSGFCSQATGNDYYASFVNTSSNSAVRVVQLNRQTSDGDLIQFKQADTTEGTISVSGTTVTYGGGHIARWSQLPNNEDPSALLKGTVMSNLDEMCEWGEEDNEQLNKTKVSDVDDDPNVAGVFVSVSPSDEGPLDFFVGMTGDMVIRIAEGVTVQRGDLLVSAGDGTARPQGDRYLKDSTIAKVTSTNVSCTYDDGSYCVPCVLMAC